MIYSLNTTTVLSDGQKDCFIRYASLIKEYQKKTNLVGSTSDDFLSELFDDCLKILKVGRALRGPLIDIGSGAGLPAVPLAIARPELEVVAVEPRNKRAAFIGVVKRALKLDNLSIVSESWSEELLPAPGTGTLCSKALCPADAFLKMGLVALEQKTDIACYFSQSDKEIHVKAFLEAHPWVRAEFYSENLRSYGILSHSF